MGIEYDGEFYTIGEKHEITVRGEVHELTFRTVKDLVSREGPTLYNTFHLCPNYGQNSTCGKLVRTSPEFPPYVEKKKASGREISVNQLMCNPCRDECFSGDPVQNLNIALSELA